jgi:tetratricopeptide (TPR) repeat protein
LIRNAFAIRSRTLGPEHFETLEAKADLSDVRSREGHIREAEKLQRETLATMLRVLGLENLSTLEVRVYLARTLNSEGHFSEVEKMARENYAAALRILGLQDSVTVGTLQQLGEALAYSHRYPEAAKLFQDAIAKDANSSQQGNRFQLWYAFACVAAAANRQDEALRYLQEAVNRGNKNADGMAADDDLKNLRPDSHFQELVRQLRQQTQSARAH